MFTNNKNLFDLDILEPWEVMILFISEFVICVPLYQVVVVTEYLEGQLFQILEDDGNLPESQVHTHNKVIPTTH